MLPNGFTGVKDVRLRRSQRLAPRFQKSSEARQYGAPSDS